MTDEQTPAPRSLPPAPGPMAGLFAVVFLVAMGFNLYYDRNPMVTIFLGSAALLVLGFDVGRISGKK